MSFDFAIYNSSGALRLSSSDLTVKRIQSGTVNLLYKGYSYITVPYAYTAANWVLNIAPGGPISTVKSGNTVEIYSWFPASNVPYEVLLV